MTRITKNIYFFLDRLSSRLWTLRNLSLRSIHNNVRWLNQFGTHNPDIVVLLYTSDKLPWWARATLTSMLSDFEQAQIQYLPPCEAFPGSYVRQDVTNIMRSRQGGAVATVSLDDDDILADHVLQEICGYTNEVFFGHAASMGRGLVGVFSSEKKAYTQLYHCYHPKIIIGLSYINYFDPTVDRFICDEYATVTEFGAHLNIDAYAPLILASSSPAWIRTVHDGNDSLIGRKGRKSWINEMWAAGREDMETPFPVTDYPLDTFHERSVCSGGMRNLNMISMDSARKTLKQQQIKKMRRRIRRLKELNQ